MKQRLITGILAGGAFLTLLYLGGYWFSSIIVLLALIGFYEFARMNHFRSSDISTWIGYAGVLYIVLPFAQWGIQSLPDTETVLWMGLFAFFCITVISKNQVTIDRIAVLFIGMIYIGIGFHYMIVVRDLGLFWTILIFACIWGTDSGAYFTGMVFGKTKLWPSISPKKTIEGAIGGIFISIGIAVCFSFYDPIKLHVMNAIMIGIVVAIVGQMGDLIQSAYKRVRDIKDTGALLPGHGGVLDRCDSWLIVFPFVYYLSLIH